MDVNFKPNPYKLSYDNNERETSKTKNLIQKLENSILDNEEELLSLKKENDLLKKKNDDYKLNFMKEQEIREEKKRNLINKIKDEKNKLYEIEENIKLEKKNFIESKKINLSNLEKQIFKLKEEEVENCNFYNTLNHKIEIQNGFFKMQINLIKKK